VEGEAFGLALIIVLHFPQQPPPQQVSSSSSSQQPGSNSKAFMSFTSFLYIDWYL
jgi:hypothetical protein